LISIDGDQEPIAINHDIPAASSNPVFAPDGTLAYLQMLEPKYEADRNRIVLYNGQTRTYIAENWDRSPSSLVFSKDSKTIFVTAEEHGHTKIFAIERETGNVNTLTDKHTVSSLSVVDGKLVFNLASMNHPNIVTTLDLESGELKTHSVTNELDVLMKGLDMPKPEEFWFIGSRDAKVHGWIIKPADFDPYKKYPVAFLIHGGPQGSWGSSW
jgi:dipeptidyl aminopeptidase/acylaminoacyl peptidase